MEIVILAIGVVCAGVFVHTFLILESQALYPVRIPGRIDPGGRPGKTGGLGAEPILDRVDYRDHFD